MILRHDIRLRETARAIYEAVYPSNEWTDLEFSDAERYGTAHYRNAVDAALRANVCLFDHAACQLHLPL